MSKSNAKKIEKLKKKIEEIDERMKNDIQLKQEYVKEIQSLEADSILSACKSSNITVGEAMESFDLFNLVKEKGMSVSDVQALLGNDTSQKVNISERTTVTEVKKDE